MELKLKLTHIISFCIFLFTTVSFCHAQSISGIQKMLEILQQKNILSATEAGAIRQAVEADLEALSIREKALDEKEQNLLRREIELDAKENDRSPNAKPVMQSIEGATKFEQLGGKSNPESTAATAADTDSEKTGNSRIGLVTSYSNGFCLNTADPKDFALCLGGLFQEDYRYYEYEDGDPNNNKFDIRRARLQLKGNILQYFGYKFLYEFEGAGSRNLLDAYVDIHTLPYASLRLGQFKEPFGLEQNTADQNLWFSERSIGYFLTPRRDVGAMVHASILEDRLNYGFGIFNGDGLDDSTGGDTDSPQFTGRLTLTPFRKQNIPLGENLHFGGSLSYARVDRSNVDVELKTGGLTTFLNISPNSKFSIVQDADSLLRYGLEFAWSYGSFAVMSEYVLNKYNDVVTSNNQFDFDLEDYYVALLWMITGEEIQFREGVLQPIKPNRSFWESGWGAFGVALRYDNFQADDIIYDTLVEPGVSVRKAESFTGALNWYLNPYARFILNFIRTNFDQPLLIERDSQTGKSVFSDHENVFTARFQFLF
jgi:phosphate-selective porin OprO/OprP